MGGSLITAFVAVFLSLQLFLCVVADEITIDAMDAGFVTEFGGTAKGDGTLAFPATFNYSVGQAEHFSDGSLTSALAPTLRKNYFVFDLFEVESPISAATLKLYMGPDTAPDYPAGEHGYESLDPFETYEISETTDPFAALMIISDLLTGSIVDGPGGFDSPADPLVLAAADLYTLLGDGTPLAGLTTTSEDDDTFLLIEFSDLGVAYLNAFIGGPVVLSGELTSIDADDTTELIFGFTGPDVLGGTEPEFIPELIVITVPEPDGATMCWGLMIFLTTISNRKRTMAISSEVLRQRARSCKF